MKVIIGIATMPGREVFLPDAVNSLKEQCDHVHVYDNGKEEVDLTDNGKFSFLKEYKEPIYYFSCDDDLIYPSDYVSRSIKAIERTGCIITYHGRKLLGKNRNYYTGHKPYRWNQDIGYDVEIDVAGTGVTAFRTDYFNPVDIHLSQYKKMSDVVFSLEAARQKKRIMIASHKRTWIRYQETLDPKKTIHGTESKNCSVQGELCNMILDLKNRK